MKNLFYSYVTSRHIGELFLPVPAQNSCLREAAKRQDKTYILPRLEHHFDDSYIEFFTIINTAKQDSIIGMYSMLMLPIDYSFLEKITYKLKTNKLTLFFVLENRYFNVLDDIIDLYNSYFLCKQIKKLSPKHSEIKNAFKKLS